MSAQLRSSDLIGREIAARLATCTVAAGAETDLGVAVFRGRRVVDEDAVPCCALIEGEDEVTQSGSKRAATAEVRQQFDILAYIACDPLHPNDAAHAAIRDVKRALFRTAGTPDTTLGGQVVGVTYVGKSIGPRADGSGYLVAAVTVTVTFVEELANP